MKKPLIAWILDEKLDAEATKSALKMMAALKPIADITTFDGTLSQESIVEALEKTKFQLVMLPWYKYLAWKKVEAFFGLTRTSGPTVAAYTAETLDPKNFPDIPDYPRFYLFDLVRFSPNENLKLITPLLSNETRTGIQPLLKPNSTIHFFNWDGRERTSLMLEGWFELPEFSGIYKDRKHAISSAFEGAKDLLFGSSISTSGMPCVHFGMDAETITVRIGVRLATAPNNQMIQTFWSKSKLPLSPLCTLSRYTDFFRAQWSSTPHQLDLTLVWTNSKPSERNTSCQMRATWLEPVSADLSREEPLFIAKPEGVYKALPEIILMMMAGEDTNASSNPSKVQALQKQLLEKEQLIKDLKSGGASVPMKSSLPDEEALIEALKQRLKMHPEKRNEVLEKLKTI